MAAGVLVLTFDSEKGNTLFLNAFEYHLFVKCFKYLIMRRCRLCYLVLKLKRRMLCRPVWTVAHLCIPPARAASFALFQTLNGEEGKMPLEFARPKGKSLQAVPALTSTERGMELVSLLPAAALGLGHCSSKAAVGV